MQSIPIHDIKSLSTIPDYSFYIFLFLIILLFIIGITLIYFIIKYFKNKNSSTQKKAYAYLKNLNFNHSKEASYAITKYGRLLISNDHEKKLFEELIEQLEQYKYKKEVEAFDDTIKKQFERFMDAIDVK